MSNTTIQKTHPLAKYQFKPGQSGNPKGRARGSRNKLGEAFVLALQQDFQSHGAEVIERVRQKKPDAYLKVIAQVIPSELNVRVSDQIPDDELDDRIQQLARLLRLEVGTAGPSVREEAANGSEQTPNLPPLLETGRIS